MAVGGEESEGSPIKKDLRYCAGLVALGAKGRYIEN